MPFINAAGFVVFRALACSSAKADLPEAYAAPVIGRTPAYGSVSNAICGNAAECNRLELERFVRRRNTESQFRDALTNLKNRLAWKAAAPALAYCRAS